MNKIAIAGYHYSGCGVIDDLFREFDNVAQALSEHESRFLQDMDGVSDLEHFLVEDPTRLKISLSLDRFLRYCKHNEDGYRCIYGKEWIPICKDYVDSLIKFRFKGYNMNHLEERSKVYLYYVRLMYYLQFLKPKRYRHSLSYNYFPNETLFHTLISEDFFLEKTRSFVDRLAEHMITDKKAEYVMIDQMFPGNNPNRYMRYVNDVKGFVVDRDPRDLYINMMNREDHMIPTEPHQFCVHYRDTRHPVGERCPDVMYLMIEDMIYHYDEMVPRVCEFVGIDLSHHVEPKKYFNPAISIKGTRTWERFPKYEEAVRVIEQELSDYLYKNY